jgi:hypothetical protein
MYVARQHDCAGGSSGLNKLKQRFSLQRVIFPFIYALLICDDLGPRNDEPNIDWLA